MILFNHFSHLILDGADAALKALYENAPLFSKLFVEYPIGMVLTLVFLGAVGGFLFGRHVESIYNTNAEKRRAEESKVASREYKRVVKQLKECRKEIKLLTEENKRLRKGKK